jgi:hypothetical protein
MESKKLTVDDALPIAERHIADVIANSKRLRRYEFGPVLYSRDNDRVWTFAAGSRQLQEEGYVPGAVFASIDKVDGHVWSNKEQERYAQSLSPIPPPPKPVNAAGKEMMDVEDVADIARDEMEKRAELEGRELDGVRLSRWNKHYLTFCATFEDGGEALVFVEPFYGRILSAEEAARIDANLRLSQSALQPIESYAA